MRIFVSVVHHGSLSSAGRELGLSPASVSRHLSALEKELGCRLINRSSRNLTLTETKRSADRFLTQRNWTAVEQLRALAEERGRTLLDLSLGWLASRPTMASVIAGATSPEQVDANVAAATARLDADELAAVDRICPASRSN